MLREPMLADPAVTFHPTWAFAAALVLFCILLAALYVRRARFAGLTIALIAAGALVLSSAAATPTWNRPAGQWVAVMVDLSPSTRTATYRDPATLDRRIHELL